MVQARWYNEDTGTWEKFIVSNEGIQGPPGPLPDEDKIVRDLKEKVEAEVEPLMLSLSQAELARQEAEGVREETYEKVKDLPKSFQNVIDETTGKDVISAPEIIAARDGEANLKARLDKEHQEVTAQLMQTVR